MKHFLFLDDDNKRHLHFHKMLKEINIPTRVMSVVTATECIEQLQEEVWDVVFLDHDLCIPNIDGEWKGRWDLENGMDVVEFIALHLKREKWPHKIVIHSHNDTAAKAMEGRLWEAGWLKGGKLLGMEVLEFPSPQTHTEDQFIKLLQELINA